MTDSAPLSLEEVRALLNADQGAVIIGGQALALWSLLFKIALPTELEAAVTDDLDFYGDRKLAMGFARSIPGARVIFPDPDKDPGTPNSAIVLIDNFLGQKGRTVQIDYLAVIRGVNENKAASRSVAIYIDGVAATKKVLHPVDCLLSRIGNLDLPAKQNDKGYAQARLAIQVVNRYIRELLRSGAEKDALKFAELIARLAERATSLDSRSDHGIDVLDAVPADAYRSEQFKSVRWPQIKAHVAKRLEKQQRRLKKG